MIHYLTGDATEPQVNKGARIIAHICNDLGGWGSGFVVALSNKWPEPERKYREWFKWATDDTNKTLPLGQIQLVQVKDPKKEGPLYVCNMIAQEGYTAPDHPVAVRYDMLCACLADLNNWIGHYCHLKSRMVLPPTNTHLSIHMPRIGCGLGGGDWGIVSELIGALLTACDVYVYDLEESNE